MEIKDAEEIKEAVRRLGSLKKAGELMRFFKTGKGEYGEGDRFLGITVPAVRKEVKRYFPLPLGILKEILMSEWHEERAFALLSLVAEYEKLPGKREDILKIYLGNTDKINNWDLVDLSAPRIVGAWCLEHGAAPLFCLAASENLWERRIAMVSSLAFINSGDKDTALALAEKLLGSKEDLMHKAVGWMLRETAKKTAADAVKEFLKNHYAELPRTTLRYAIERFPEEQRKMMLKGIF